MPIYEYQCPECHNIFEEWQNINNAKSLEPCPSCGTESARIISNTAFVLKGGGWYVTEYGNRKSSSSSNNTKATDSAKGSNTDTEQKASPASSESTSCPASSVDNSNSTTSQSASA